MEQLEEELTCAICCDIFEDPRVLPCSHTFCRPCLQGLLQPSPAGGHLSCPSCRARVPVPPAGPGALPVNFALKAVIEKCRQERPAVPAVEAGTCRAHPGQPLNVFCLRDRRLVCGQCLTIGQHRGHPIDDLQSAYRKAKEASRQFLEELRDESRSRVASCAQRLRQQKGQCREALQSDREFVLQYFKELQEALERQKEALLSSLDELDGCISEKYDPLIEEVEKLKLEESKLKELYSAVQEEESPLLFLEKLDRLQPRLQALKQKLLPELEPVEIYPRMERLLQDRWSRLEVWQVFTTYRVKLHLGPESLQKQIAAVLRARLTELRAFLTDPKFFPFLLRTMLFLLLSCFVGDIFCGTVSAPSLYLWKFLQWLFPDSCAYLRDRAEELCHKSLLFPRWCKGLFPDLFDYPESS